MRHLSSAWGDLRGGSNENEIAQAAIKAHGGVYVSAGPGTIIDGSFPKGRVVILRWESLDALKAWHESPDYQAALKIGKQYAKYNLVAVDAVKQ
jgi:uncharacterized protein (DUF1330 family)